MKKYIFVAMLLCTLLCSSACKKISSSASLAAALPTSEYRAVFTANGVSLEVAFIPQDNQYVAARATLQKQK
ncbi:MAG: hypothetical protein RSD78_09375 [Oscillospiraceae bacterium]